MNKKLLFGCLGGLIVIIIIGLVICGIGSYKVYEHINSQTKIVEELIGNKLPFGLTPIMGIDMKDSKTQFKRMNMLMNFSKSSVIIILDGPPYKNEAERQKTINNAPLEMNYKSSPHISSNTTSIKINGKNYIAFRIEDRRNDFDPKKMVMVLMDNPERALAVAYAAKGSFYDEQDAIEFFKLIKN